MQGRLTAVVIDDHEITRAALRSRCAVMGNVDVIGESSHAVHGSYVVERLQPDVVIADLVLDADGTFPLPGLLMARGIHVPVLALSGLVSRSRVRAAFTSGAYALVAKDAPASLLFQAIEMVAAGAHFIDPEIAILMLDASSIPSTPLQRDVLTAAGTGRDLRQIAAAMEMPVDAIRGCAEHILERTRELGAPREVVSAVAATLQAT